MYLGDFKEDGDLFFKFTTRAFATGVPGTLGDTPVLSVYIDEGTSPKTTAEAYFDLDVDFNSKTGLNNVRIDLSGDAFFATGADYAIVITTGEVDSVSVIGETVATFSIENRSMGQPAGATLAADIAALKTVVDGTNTATIMASGVVETSGSNSSTQVQTDLSETTNDHYDTMTIAFTSGDEAGQSRPIIGYVGSTGVVSWNAALTGTPADDVTFVILAAGTTADAVWDEILTGATHNIATSAGRRLRQLETGLILDSGTADAGAANSIDLETGVANTNDDFYNHNLVVITGGLGVGQTRVISDYVGSTQQATITPAWVTNPNATSTYDIIPGVTHAETQGGGYVGGAVWISPAGSTGTQLYVDGTIDNPIDDGQMANAKTVADALNLRIFHSLPGSSITLADTFDAYEFLGQRWTLALGGQSIDNTLIQGATVSGTYTGTPNFGFCAINSITGPSANMHVCGLMGTITANAAGNWFIHHSYSRVAGGTTPVFDFGTNAGVNSNVTFADYHNGITYNNYNNAGTDLLSLSGCGQVIFAASSSSGSVELRGDWKVTNTGGVTIVADDNTVNVAATKAVTDQMVFTKANELDANTKSINDAEVIGDGNATPWDGA